MIGVLMTRIACFTAGVSVGFILAGLMAANRRGAGDA